MNEHDRREVTYGRGEKCPFCKEYMATHADCRMAEEGFCHRDVDGALDALAECRQERDIFKENVMLDAVTVAALRQRVKELEAERDKLQTCIDEQWKPEEALWKEREAALLARVNRLEDALGKLMNEDYWYRSHRHGDGFDEPVEQASGCERCGGGFEHRQPDIPPDEIEHEPDCAVVIATAALAPEEVEDE